MCKKAIIRFSGFMLFIFCFAQTAQSDELKDLKEQLKLMQNEKGELEMKIDEMQQKIQVLETENRAKDQELKEMEIAQSAAIPTEHKWKSDVTVKYYWDTREFNTFELTTGLSGLPLGLAFWGFTDLHGNQDQIDDSFDFNRFFMEYRLSQSIDPGLLFGIKGFGTQIEYNDSNGAGNQLVRYGLTYKHDIPLFNKKGWLMWRGFPYESDGSGQQVSWLWLLPITERIFLTGFADLNLIEGGDDQWVIEPQLNIKLNDRFNFLIEYRYSGFESASATLDGEGVAIGIDMKF